MHRQGFLFRRGVNIMISDEDKMWHWFTNIKGIGRKTRNRLLETFGSLRELYGADEEAVMGINYLCMEKKRRIMDSRRRYNEKGLYDTVRSGITFIHRDSDGYPPRLKDIPDMPHALYIKGDISPCAAGMALADMPSVAVIGSRKCSKYGYETAYRIGFELADRGIAVVSGMARGIDSAALRGCIDAGGIPVAVLGCGVDICYPPNNIELYTQICRKGIIISEYPPKTEPLSCFFPERNRIISGLGDALVVVEAGVRSGTFITVDMALEQGKEVYAVPGRITDEQSRGCNSLIAQGAHVFMDAGDIAGLVRDAGSYNKRLSCAAENSGKDDSVNYAGTPNDKKVYSAVGILPKHIDMISKETGISIDEVMVSVCSLEIKKLIRHTDNNYFIRGV